MFIRPLSTRLKLRLHGMYHPAYYPDCIFERYNELLAHSSVMPAVPKSWDFFNSPSVNSNTSEFTVNCAGTQCELSQLSSLWCSLSSEGLDAEVVQSSHRFHYFIEKLAEGICEGDRSRILDTIDSWLNDFDHKVVGAAWQPYTVSERLCNWVVCWQVLKPQSDRPEFAVRWLHSIHHQAIFLASKLEYPASGIVNNHILNNARALYIVGHFLDQEAIAELGRRLLQLHLPHMIGSGFLLEASSHYQLLLTRTVLEVEKIAHVTNDKSFEQWLGNLPLRMLAASQKLLPNHLYALENMPRIGDVSPDVPFSWFSPCSYNLPANWNTLWSRPTQICDDIQVGNQDGWLVQENGAWYSVVYSHPDTSQYPVGHGHNDFGSCCLYYDGYPIIIDVGRLDYNPCLNTGSKGIAANMHNTVILNEDSLLPAGQGWESIISGSARRRADCYKNNVATDNAINWSLSRQRGVCWSRELDFTSLESIKLTDQFTNINEAKGYLHFSPDAVVEKLSNDCVSLKIGCCMMNIFIQGASIWLEKNDFFPRYGESCKATRLCWKADLDCQISEVEVRFVAVHPNNSEIS